MTPSCSDKRFHKWGQSEFDAIKYIGENTHINDIVFDPFCGGGTTPAVCKTLGIHFLSFEIDPKTAEDARQRLFTTQTSLFVPPPEQTSLFPN
jgi:hypothetical protein